MKHFKDVWKEKLRYGCSMLLSTFINKGVSLQQLQPREILCIKEDEIGDMCYALHVFDLLHQQYPDAKITLLCKPYSASLLQSNPHIHQIVTDYARLQSNYNLIIDLRGSWKSIIFALKHKPNARLDRATVRYQNSKNGKQPHEVITNWQVIAPLFKKPQTTFTPTIYLTQQIETSVDQYLTKHNLSKFVLLHIGSRKVLKKWHQFEQLALLLKHQHNFDIVFIGDQSEQLEITHLMSKLPFTTFSVAGLFDLQELSALCKRASLYVGNDSGPLHIAAISGLKCIGLYGPAEPEVFYPWGDNSEVIHHVLECNPCNQIECVHEDNPCIQRITLFEVAEKIHKLLA